MGPIQAEEDLHNHGQEMTPEGLRQTLFLAYGDQRLADREAAKRALELARRESASQG